MTHTPGPWGARAYSVWATGKDGDVLLAECGVAYLPPGEHEANARLIAAAPELLEALETAVSLLLGTAPIMTAGYKNSLIAGMNAAIAKAKEPK